jgi:Rrf2 family protein
MRFTQAAAYGISAATYLAHVADGEIVSNTVICEALQIPQRFVLQILRQMALAGVVKSTRGVLGGFTLAKPASEISLLDIVEAVDGPIGANEAIDLAGMSTNSQAAVDKMMATIVADARKQLASVTLADLRASKAA